MEIHSFGNFEIAKEAMEKNPNLKVIIVKRLTRHDKSNHVILDIKWMKKSISNNFDKC